MTGRPKSEWLEAFVAFAAHLNFTRAARSMGLSQPALHVQIRKLSEQLGAPLYRRQGRGLVLTAKGVETLAFARDFCARADAFMGRQGPARPVVLSAGEGAFLYLLDDVIERVLQSDPGGLRLRVDRAEATLRAVRQGDADLGVCPLVGETPDLDVEWIADVGLALVMRPTDPLSHFDRVSLDQLRGRSLIVPPPGPVRNVLASVSYETAVEVRGWPLALHLASLGVGPAVVNDVCRVPAGLCLRQLDAPRTRFALVRRRHGWRAPRAESVWAAMSSA